MKKFALIASQADPAGVNIHRQLCSLGFEQLSEHFHDHAICALHAGDAQMRLYLIADELLAADNLETQIDADHFIFLSKHRSGSNTKSFAVHSIGNWAEAKAGGKDKEIVASSALLQQLILLEFLKNPREGYEITMEATHHGPFTATPSLFVEVGSTEEEWQDDQNGKIIAHAVVGAITHYASPPGRNEKPLVAIGIGGPHYCNNFNKLSSRKNYAFAHICPKHFLGELDQDMMGQAIEKNVENIERIVLDWKGLGQEKQKVLDLAHKTGIQVERTDQLLKE